MIECSRSQLDAVIDDWIIGNHAERNRKILKRRLFDGITFEALAEEVDMSPRQVRTIVHRCEEIIFKHVPG